MDVTQNTIIISCHCGAARQTLTPPKGTTDVFSGVSFCHCDTCRHLTGLLCTSYAPIASQPPPSLAGLESYPVSSSSTRYFCSTCGCHVFRASRPSPSAPPEQWEWAVATGVISHAPESETFSNDWQHRHVKDTQDGGLHPWLSATNPSAPDTTPSVSPDDILHASCHCSSVSLLITRASPDLALNPDSPYPDLLLPYHSTPSATIANPSREKWYLRPVPAHEDEAQPNPACTQPAATTRDKGRGGPSRYLAGTCACATCRLTSGFEIQTWAFIPRRNIFIIPTSPPSTPDLPSPMPMPMPSPPDQSPQTCLQPQPQPQPLDFTTLPATTPLKPYSSTPNRTREFCRRCGATVFWHDTLRPDLIDVSAGLFREDCPASAAEAETKTETKTATETGTKTETETKTETSGGSSARAESWLAWWTRRVSFAEEAGRDRTGGAKTWGEGVIRTLEMGMERLS